MSVDHHLEFREVSYGSHLHERSVDLRDRILRKPLGLQFSEEDLKREITDHHLVCLDGNIVIGVILMRPSGNDIIKMRQVAIDEKWQRSGVGSQLVGFAENFSIDQGFKRIEMHSRKAAVPFYLRLDYQTEGEEFYEVGIPHYIMFKVIGDQ